MTSLERRLLDVLQDFMSTIMARTVIKHALQRSSVDGSRMSGGDVHRLLSELTKGVCLYLGGVDKQRECITRLKGALADVSTGADAAPRRVVVDINTEDDIVAARGAGRDICQQIGFNNALQIKVATAISELARNIVQYANRGEVRITALDSPRTGVEIVAKDRGEGISNLDEILTGRYKSKLGMGMGLKGTRNMMDEFDVETSPSRGTQVTIRKYV
jgi:serine/threonine-protein kinase RsbT